MQVDLESIILFVRDVNKLKAFYAENFDLEVIEDSAAEWGLLKAGTVNIGLHKRGEEGAGVAKYHNNTKIVFHIQEDIQEVREKLITKGVEMREVKTFDGYEYWLCDGEEPEGNVFQLKQRR